MFSPHIAVTPKITGNCIYYTGTCSAFGLSDKVPYCMQYKKGECTAKGIITIRDKRYRPDAVTEN